MKKVLIILLFLLYFTRVFAQQNAYLRGDSIILTNKTKSAIIVLQNATKDSTGAFAKNMGHGVINFKKVAISDIKGLSDSLSKKIYFSDNFKYVDTVVDLQKDTVRAGKFFVFDRVTGRSGVDTNHYLPLFLTGNTTVNAQGHILTVKSLSTTQPAFVVDGLNTSGTPTIAEFKFNGTRVAAVGGAGGFFGSGVVNNSGGDLAFVNTDASGTIISRKIADGNSVLRVFNFKNTSTGDFLTVLDSASTKFTITRSGGIIAPFLPDTTAGYKALVVDVNGKVQMAPYGSGGGSTGINGLNGTTNIGLGGQLSENTTEDINGHNMLFSDYGGYGSFSVIESELPSSSRDSANYAQLSWFTNGIDGVVNKDISHKLSLFIEPLPRAGFHSAFQINDQITHNGIEISGINHASYWGNNLVNKSYTDSTAKAKADSVVAAHPGGVSSFNTRTGAVTLTSGDVTGALTYTPYNATNPSNYIALTALSATSPIFYNNSTGVISSQAATTSLNGYLTSTDWNTFNGKQATLVSGTNIKTVNGNSLLGSGDVVIASGTSVANEAPSGSINSSNVTFTLAHTPVSGSVRVYLNGIHQTAYTMSTGTITFSSAPFTGDNLVADYQY